MGDHGPALVLDNGAATLRVGVAGRDAVPR